MPKFRYAKPAPIKWYGYFPAAILRRKYSSGFTFHCRYGPCATNCAQPKGETEFLCHTHACTHACTHTRLTALFLGLPRWAGTRKVKPIWILLKQYTVSCSGTSWAICKSAPRSRQITMPAHHHSVFYRPDLTETYKTHKQTDLTERLNVMNMQK